jgi:Putative transposase
VRAGDAEGRERLCRSGARPPFSLERLSLLPDGRVAYRLRRPRRNGATHLVMTPVSFLARIAGLMAPPRFPRLRQSGVLVPNAPWRAAVVGYGRGGDAAAKATHDAQERKRRMGKGKRKDDGNAAAILVDGGARRDEVGDMSRSSSSRTRLGSGVVQGVGARIDWARWLRRVDLDEVLACTCGALRRVLADVHDPEVVTAIVVHLGLPTEGPAVARARDPTGCEAA